MKKIFKNLHLGIIAISIGITSCYDDPGTDILFSGAFIELDAAGTPAFNRTFTYLRLNDGNSIASGFKVNLASAPTGAVNFTYAINAASTAVDGLHYVVNSTSGTIAAGEFSTLLAIDIMPDNISAGERLNIIIELISADIEINPEYDSAGHIIQISCPPNIPAGGTWTGVTTEGAFGVFANDPAVVITDEGDGVTYSISDGAAGFWFAFGGTEGPGKFTNICDAIIMTASSDFGSFGTDPANGAPEGTFDPVGLVLTIPWYNPNNDFGDISQFTRN